MQLMGSSTKRSYVVPVVVAIAVFAVFTAIGVFVYKTRLLRQRNGRMKLTEHHADTLTQPYHEQKTFENPIYQPCDEVIAVECRDELDALKALRTQIDQELLDLSFLSEGESLGQRELRKSTSAPDLRNLQVTVTDMESSSVCSVDDLSQGSAGAVRFLGTSSSSSGNANGFVAVDVKRSKEWLDTYL